MPRCGCANDQCSCRIVQGEGTVVEGTGSQTNPYVIHATGVSGGGGGGGARITGEIIGYGGAVAPDGWLICDGSEVSRTVYSALFNVIGVTNGAGNGETTFNLPGGQGRTLIGVNGTYPRGTTGGAAQHTLTTGELPAHAHSMNHDHPSTATSSSGTHDHTMARNDAEGGSPTTVNEGSGGAGKVTDRGMVGSDGDHTHTVDLPAYVGNTGNAGSGTPINMLPPYVAVNFLIKT